MRDKPCRRPEEWLSGHWVGKGHVLPMKQRPYLRIATRKEGDSQGQWSRSGEPCPDDGSKLMTGAGASGKTDQCVRLLSVLARSLQPLFWELI